MNPGTEINLSHIASSWEQFITADLDDPDAVRPEIIKSWERCHAAGVDPFTISGRMILDSAEVEDLIDRHKDFIEIARHFMIRLYEFVKGSGFIVLLSDEQGCMLEVIGDQDTLVDAAKINLIKGSSWDERYVGTNGVGTVLMLERPFQVTGPEHYCQSVHGWTCSAAPIFHDHGGVRGVLQLSGPSHAAHLHTLGMVVAAVDAISEQIRIKEQNRELTVLNNSLTNMFQTMTDGALLIDKEGIITQINPPAEEILGNRVIGNPIETILGTMTQTGMILGEGRSYTDIEVMLKTSTGGIHCLGSGKPIKDEQGRVSGAVVFFNPINKVKKLINRFSGAQASFTFGDIMGGHDKIQQAVRIAYRASANKSNVIIEGESGTGKELFAQAIHNESARQEGPFLALNCAALPRDLIAAELFGYSEGAFTGASRGGRPGKFEMASGGTLFLDEIGDMPLDQQASLLRVLQEKKITRIGGDKVIPVDVRIICATNKNLKAEVKKGNFRQDLYYRLNVIVVSVPPLRDRGDDVLMLFDYFLKKVCRKSNTDIRDASPDVRACLVHYDWPGNVRELENVVERIIHMAEGGQICLRHLPAEIASSQCSEFCTRPEIPLPEPPPAECGKNIKQLLEEQERQMLLVLLQRYKGNVTQTAREIGVSRNTVYRKMQLYGILRQYSFD